MTPVGHSLVGASLGVVSLPRYRTTRTKVLFLAGFILLANVPDFAFTGWGHDRYDVSHSVFVALAVLGGVAGLMAIWRRAREAIGGWWIVAAGAAAWLSHLLLDSFYSHGQGIAI
jgi:hypothetical protein